MDLISGIAAASQAISLVKDLRELEGDYNEAQLKAKLSEIYSSLADVKMALADAQVANSELSQQIEKLEKAMRRKADLIEVRDLQYEKNDAGEAVGRPFCSVCLEEGIFMKVTQDSDRSRDDCRCPRCKAIYSHAYRDGGR